MTITLLSQAPDILNLKTRHVQKETALIISPPFVGHEDPIQGDVLICEDRFYFYSESSQTGIAVDYRDIIIHAISRQEGDPSIFCQLDSGLFFPNQQLPEDDYERQETLTELRFIPRDKGAVEGIYQAMSECAALYPDEDLMAEQDSDHQTYFADLDHELNEEQQAALDRLDSLLEPSEGSHSNDSVDKSL
ncbi:hypothetical protein G6F46_005747 [Rhizopus delemar]|uniref:Uncharacterized protein n=2 Tax=Rhizopus TaxID=4842 RepID=A0A9P6Z064_9FUNG|nr:hypothetical protein G6F55_004274 [Rhizopus delemar]KAG1544366.1 hypothetical protein G6F51_006101 [Rhizopus arrhizus]KAG1498004.1 hypothetical protein G6F54_005373 [Rhizopus delemar]KAG1511772.1 hypothetical protein G6F53_005681 [Rhizopus delemar]KAG1555272.1 hypothetical protein G6F49_007306 [Rhizopus delemar]